jgi:hypothetical protein
VLRDQLRGIATARVDALQFGLAPRVVKPVRPEVAGIADELATACQVNRVIICRRAQNQ